MSAISSGGTCIILAVSILEDHCIGNVMDIYPVSFVPFLPVKKIILRIHNNRSHVIQRVKTLIQSLT